MSFELEELGPFSGDTDASPDTFKALSAHLDHAIACENLPLLEDQVREWKRLMDSEEDFSEDLFLMNPLAKAVLANCPAAVGFLIKTCGVSLETFHPSSCKCCLCRRLAVDGRFLQRHLMTVVLAASRPLFALYIDSDDAIAHCLWLRRQLRRYEGRVTATSWKPIVNGLEDTIVAVLEVASNAEEAIQLLQEPGEGEQRLDTVLELVDSDLLSVCAHPTVQAIVDREWYGESFPVNLRTMPLPLRVLLGLLCYVLLTPAAIVCPHPRLLQVLRTPVVRYASESFSYVFTLVFSVVTASVTHADITMMCDPRQDQWDIRFIELWQLLLMIMFTALILRFATGFWSCGQRFFVSGYDFLHFFGVVIHFFGSLLILLFFEVLPELNSFKDACEWFLALPDSLNIDSSCVATEAAYKRHPVVMDAIKTYGEPYIVGTTIFGFGHLLYFASAGHVLTMMRLMSAFIIAVEKMVLDVARWFIFCIIFFLAWAIALKTIYSSYHCNNVPFSSFSRAIRQLFWVSLTMADRNDYKLVGEVARSPSWLEIMIERVGWLMYMLFFLVGAIILLNLLIALMAVTFQNIKEDEEFVIIRRETKVKLKFILWKDDLSAPFNLFHPVLLVSKLVWKRASKFCCRGSQSSSDHSTERNRISVQSKMRSLSEEYRGSQSCEDNDEPTSESSQPV